MRVRAAAIAAILIALTTIPCVQGAIPLRIGLGADGDPIRHAAATSFRAEIERISGGRMHASVAGPALWGRPSASELELVRAVIAGDPPAAVVSSAALTNFSPSFDVLDAPGLFVDEAHAITVLHGPCGRALLDTLGPAGMRGLAFLGPDFRVLVGPAGLGNPLTLRSTRMATLQSTSAGTFVEALGGEAVPAPLERLSEMAQKGFVDGADLAPSSLRASSADVSWPLTLDTRHAISASVLIANRRFFEELAPENRLLIWRATLASMRSARDEAQRLSWAWRASAERAHRLLTFDARQRAQLGAALSTARALACRRVDPSILHDIEALRPPASH